MAHFVLDGLSPTIVSLHGSFSLWLGAVRSANDRGAAWPLTKQKELLENNVEVSDP